MRGLKYSFPTLVLGSQSGPAEWIASSIGARLTSTQCLSSVTYLAWSKILAFSSSLQHWVRMTIISLQVREKLKLILKFTPTFLGVLRIQSQLPPTLGNVLHRKRSMNVNSTSLPIWQQGQILSEDDPSFYREQSLLPNCNPIGEVTYGGRVQATVSNFLSGPLTSGPSLLISGLVWTSFPRDLLPELRRSREGQGDLLLQTLPKGLWKSIYQILQAYILSLFWNAGKGL